MKAEDRTALLAVASAIAFPIVGDRARTDELVARSMAWLDEQPDAAAAPIPWLASHVVAEAVVDRPVDGRTQDARRAHLAAALRAEPVAARTAFALRVLCGYDLQTTAAICRRTTAEVEALLEPLSAASVGVAELADSTESAESAESSAVDLAPSGNGPRPGTPPPAPAGPAAAPPTPGDRRNGGPDTAADPEASKPAGSKRRWFRPRGGTIATVLLVLAVAGVVTYPGGARPSFADPPKADSCTSATPGPGTAKTVAVGPSHRPARIFYPTGSGLGRAVMLLIGDNRFSAEDTVATTGFESAAATQGFVLVTLDGTAGPWNAGVDPSLNDDITYADAAIDQATAHGCADRLQLSVVGYGSGAHMAATVACSPTVHAHQLVMIRGQYLPPTCQPAWPISVLIDADQSDTVLPVSGGWGSVAPTPGYTPSSLDDAFRGWATLEECTPVSTSEAAPDNLVITSRTGCTAAAQVVTRTSAQKGHDWPAEAIGSTVRFVNGA